MIECNTASPDPCPQVMYIIHEDKNEIFNNRNITVAPFNMKMITSALQIPAAF